MKFYPSLMCLDFVKLHSEIAALDATDIAGYHIDIMDGNFVPNFALGSNDIKAVSALSGKELDIHLMTVNTDQAILPFLKLPAHRISFHYETCVHHHRVVTQIRERGAKAGIALNPGTSVNAIADILPELDFVVAMTVNPGFAGQKYLEFTTEKIRELARIRRERGLSFEIEVDGATSPDKIKLLSSIGADSFVLGTSALFGKGRPYSEIIPELHALGK